jgi:nucleoside-diphosphate-sugar epimerase
MERGRGTYNVGGGTEASMLETIQLLERISGRKLEIEIARRFRATSAGRKADTTRIRKELAWVPAPPGGRFGGSVAVVCR